MSLNVTVADCPIKKSLFEQQMLNLVLMGPMAIIGMFLNINNIIILRRQKHRSNSIYLLECLAFVDLTFLFCQFIRVPLRFLIAYGQVGDVLFRTDQFHLQPWMFYIMLPTTIAMIFGRNWVIVLVTLERLISIMLPFWARNNINKSRLRWIVIGINTVAVSIGSVWWFANGVMPANDPCAAPITERIWVKDGADYIWNVDWYCFQVPAIYVPIFIILFANVALIYLVIKSSRDRGKLTDREQTSTSNRQVTLMILCMAIIFIVCETPTSVDRLLMAMGLLRVEDISLTGNAVLSYVKMLGDVLQVIDSSINFVAYCLTNRSFRRAFVEFWVNSKSANTAGITNATDVSSKSIDNASNDD